MSYSTYTSILPILPNLPQTSTSAGHSVTVDTIQRHIARADTIIDGKVANRYVVPFSTTPSLITTISQDITSYFSYRSFFTNDNQNVSEHLDEFKEALELLDQIRNGEMDLIGGTELLPDSVTATDVKSNTQNYQTFFDKDSEFSWAFDQDELDAINGKR